MVFSFIPLSIVIVVEYSRRT